MSIKKSFWRAVYLFSFLAVIGCTKNSHEQSPLDIPQVEVKNKAVRIHPYYRYCTWRNLSLEDWIKQDNAILIGKVDAVRPRLPQDHSQENNCWAYVKAEEWLKGIGPESLWVSSTIDEEGKTFADFEQLHYCNFKEGKRYLIFGNIYDKVSYKETSFILVTATQNGSTRNYFCGPTKEITKENKDPLVEKVRNILRGHSE